VRQFVAAALDAPLIIAQQSVFKENDCALVVGIIKHLTQVDQVTGKLIILLRLSDWRYGCWS